MELLGLQPPISSVVLSTVDFEPRVGQLVIVHIFGLLVRTPCKFSVVVAAREHFAVTEPVTS